MIYMFLSNNPSSGDINSSNLSCFYRVNKNISVLDVAKKKSVLISGIAEIRP